MRQVIVLDQVVDDIIQGRKLHADGIEGEFIDCTGFYQELQEKIFV